MDAKIRAKQEAQRRLFAFLDRRIPELHRAGVPGVKARHVAMREYAQSR